MNLFINKVKFNKHLISKKINNLFLLLILICPNYIISQNESGYFQQRTDYYIDCTLNETSNLLTGNVKIIYFNQSPDALDKIGMHLWPNAYSNKKTDFAKQKLLHRSTRFLDAEFEQQGFIKVKNLTVNGINSKLDYLKNKPDMAWLRLNQVLKPKDSLVINAQFELKIPESFSRLGHVENSYQITQWYLKPAVYDQKGWHLFPYLDQGEFFGDFGKYHVSITIPENYVVAATGVLQDSSEQNFLEQRIKQTELKKVVNDELGNSSKYKTLHYVADSVHDFAWFADKNFMVSKVKVSLNSGKEIFSWAFYNDLKYWSKASYLAARAIQFYSDKLGEYPWPQVTVVHSALSAGGGMEYPMITVINDVNSEKSLDEVICHEVGHNWFQGILATNERDHPWMDEGINTYYENEYMTSYYAKSSIISKYGIKIFNKLNIKSETEVIYQTMAHENLDQHPNQTSNNFMFLNYGIDVYQRTGALFSYLKDYIGEQEFNRVMKLYFENWKFRHPYPEDLKNIFKLNCKKNTDWLFDHVLNEDKKIDYSVINIKHSKSNNLILSIQNNGTIAAPVKIYSIKNDSILRSQWVDGFLNEQEVEIQNLGQEKLVIDYEGKYFDYNRGNNSIRTYGIFKMNKPLSIGITNLWYNSEKKPVLIYPSVLWNSNNGIMLGFSLRRPIIPRGNWNWNFCPKYAFLNHEIAGTLGLSYRLNLIQKKINYIKAGIKCKSFAYGAFDESRTNDYFQIQPYFEIDFKSNLASLHTSRITAEYFHIVDKKYIYNNNDSSSRRINEVNKIYKIKYYFSNPSIKGPSRIISEAYFENYKTFENLNAYYLRIDLDFQKSFRWSKRRYFDLRLATSFYPYNTERAKNAIATRSESGFIRGSSGASFQNFLDYSNESNFLGRTQSSGLFSQQIDIRQGGMKIVPGIAQRSNLGNTNNFVVGLNLSSDLPIQYVGKIVRPYFDLALLDLRYAFKSEQQLLYSGGIQLKIVPEVLSFYFPVLHSNNIRQIYRDNGGNYFKQVCFSLNLSFEHMKEIINFVQ